MSDYGNERREVMRDRLLRVEPPRPEHRERYEKEIREMFEKTLTRWQKIIYGAVGIMTLGLAVTFGFIAVSPNGNVPLLGRIGFAVGALFSAGWVLLTARTLKRGTVNLMRQSRAGTGLTWGFAVAITTLFMLQAGMGPDKVRSVLMVVNGLVFLVAGVAFVIVQHVEQSELRTREKLLEMELRLAEIADALKSRG